MTQYRGLLLSAQRIQGNQYPFYCYRCVTAGVRVPDSIINKGLIQLVDGAEAIITHQIDCADYWPAWRSLIPALCALESPVQRFCQR